MANKEILSEHRIERTEKENNHLPLPWRRFAGIAFYPLVAIALGFIAISVPAYISVRPEELYSNPVALPPVFLYAFHIAAVIAFTTVALISVVLSVVLFLKRPDDRMALFLSYFLLVYAVVEAGPLASLESLWPGVDNFSWSVIQPILIIPLLITFLSIFPNGRFAPPLARWLVVVSWLYGPVSVMLLNFFSNNRPLLIVGVLLWFGILFASLYAQVYRYKYVSNLIERLQVKPVVYGFSLMVLIAFLLSIITLRFQGLPSETSLPWWAPILRLGWPFAIATLPISLTVAVLRYHLFEINFLINRSLVYGGLTAAVIGIYILIVGALGTLIQAQGNPLLALLATGLVAVLFQPLRERLQRTVNRLIYGERDDPIEALAQLGMSLETAIPPDQVLPVLVKTIAKTLKLPYVGIVIQRQQVAVFGRPSNNPVAFPLTFQGETAGELLAAPRSPDESFTPAEKRLLRNLARQAGAAVRNAQLTTDLQRSRQNLVTAREEERLRLRRDLHDGLGPALASVIWQVDSARDIVPTNPSEAVQLLESSIEQAQAALADIRRLVYGLRPPALDELGLVGALEQAARQHQQTSVTIESPASFPSLPAAVEVAAYRIIQEALKNAIEHGKARNCVVGMSLDGGPAPGNLCITIRDDGMGLPETVTPGVGLVSMRERAEELGGAFAIHPRQAGGAEVEVYLPLK
jgi:signal transduction histidine kinase